MRTQWLFSRVSQKNEIWLTVGRPIELWETARRIPAIGFHLLLGAVILGLFDPSVCGQTLQLGFPQFDRRLGDAGKPATLSAAQVEAV
jgi:hypothetical protein